MKIKSIIFIHNHQKKINPKITDWLKNEVKLLNLKKTKHVNFNEEIDVQDGLNLIIDLKKN